MVSYPELRDAEPSVFTRDAKRWQTFAQRITDRVGDLDKHISTLGDWEGEAAEAARQTLRDQRKKLQDSVEYLQKIPPVLSDLGQELTADQVKLREAISTAHENSLQIRGDGVVVSSSSTETPPGQSPTPNPQPGISPRPDMPSNDQLKRLAAQLTADIQAALQHATQVDGQAASSLQKLTAQAAGLAPGGGTTSPSAASIPKAGTAPADVKKWWDSLTTEQRESLLFSETAKIGGLDGIPAEVRDRANRSVLAEQRGKLQEEKARLESQPSRNEYDDKELADINGKLRGIESIEKRLATTPSAAHPEPFLLKIGTEGHGRAIIASGNPDKAANVATFVPGTGADLSKIHREVRRSDRMAMSAATAGSPSTSVITWLGYDTPAKIAPDATQEKWAENGKQDLLRFQDGLRATHEGAKSHNTVVGHSYGTTTIGHAARDGSLNADDVVFVASPGVGTKRASDLHLTGVDQDEVGQRVHSTVADKDPIKLGAGVHGPAPTSLSFGGTTFSSDPGDGGKWYTGGWAGPSHSQYWDNGNASLTNMGRVIAGKPTT